MEVTSLATSNQHIIARYASLKCFYDVSSCIQCKYTDFCFVLLYFTWTRELGLGPWGSVTTSIIIMFLTHFFLFLATIFPRLRIELWVVSLTRASVHSAIQPSKM